MYSGSESFGFIMITVVLSGGVPAKKFNVSIFTLPVTATGKQSLLLTTYKKTAKL